MSEEGPYTVERVDADTWRVVGPAGREAIFDDASAPYLYCDDVNAAFAAGKKSGDPDAAALVEELARLLLRAKSMIGHMYGLERERQIDDVLSLAYDFRKGKPVVKRLQAEALRQEAQSIQDFADMLNSGQSCYGDGLRRAVRWLKERADELSPPSPKASEDEQPPQEKEQDDDSEAR